MHLKISSAKWWPFCPGGDELRSIMAPANLLPQTCTYIPCRISSMVTDALEPMDTPSHQPITTDLLVTFILLQHDTIWQYFNHHCMYDVIFQLCRFKMEKKMCQCGKNSMPLYSNMNIYISHLMLDPTFKHTGTGTNFWYFISKFTETINWTNEEPGQMCIL